MKSSAQYKLSRTESRPAYRTLRGWALGILIEEGAVTECEQHGHRRDLGDEEAWNRARELARTTPFSENSAEASVAAIDDVLRSIGDTCPDCK
jgi:hypothetical protein